MSIEIKVPQLPESVSDATLVASKDRAQDLKALVAKLEAEGQGGAL